MRSFKSIYRMRVLRLALALAPAVLLSGCGGGTKEEGPPVFDPIQMLVPEAPGQQVLGQPPLTLDVSNMNRGYFIAQAEDDGKMKNIQLSSSAGGVVYSYFIEPGESAVIPFTDGSDTYTATCYQQVQGSQYAALAIETLEVNLDNLFYPFLYPNQYVSFSEDSEAVKLAADLIPDEATDIEGLEATYSYVINHITYDTHKAETVEAGYLPDVDETLRTGTGICFDYAALMTAMLRSRDIPCRLVTGFAGTVKHAWVDVYIRNKGWVEKAISFDGETWERMDPTFYSVSSDADFILSYIKDGDNYSQQYAH